MDALVAHMNSRRQRIRDEMGGAQKVADLREAGVLNARERIDLLCDEGSFVEIGTFVVSAREQDQSQTPGDGKIGGHARISGNPVTVVADDRTVKRASTATMGSRRSDRLLDQALRAGNPLVVFGESAGARMPDLLDASTSSEMDLDVPRILRARRVPVISMITGDCFGGSTFEAAQADLVIQTRGSCMAITSPQLIRSATGEVVSEEELGGTSVHDEVTGQIDVVADSDEDAIRITKRILAVLPQNSWTVAKRIEEGWDVESDTRLESLVPTRLQVAYDAERVIKRVVDPDSFIELQRNFGKSVKAGLARLGGFSVMVIASQPMYQAGALEPDSCDKMTRLICMAEAYNLPIITLVDVPGFMVGSAVEHKRLLAKVMTLQMARVSASVPVLTVVLRKGFGLGIIAMGGHYAMSDRVYCWPSAAMGLMSGKSGGEVLGTEAFDDADFGPLGPAGRMRIDEIIDPGETRARLIGDLEQLLNPAGFDPARSRPLLTWPQRW